MEVKTETFPLMISVSKEKQYHFTLLFFKSTTDVDRQQIVGQYTKWVKANIKPDVDGKYTIELKKGEFWGKNSIFIAGEAATVHQKLISHVNKEWTAIIELCGLSVRPAHVNVFGNKDAPLLERVDMLDLVKSTT